MSVTLASCRRSDCRQQEVCFDLLLCGLDEPLSNSSLLAAIFRSAVLLGQKVRSKS
jgi:hypothetical protein